MSNVFVQTIYFLEGKFYWFQDGLKSEFVVIFLMMSYKLFINLQFKKIIKRS